MGVERSDGEDERVMNTERELTIDELDAVSGGGNNGGTVVAGWNTAMSGGPSGGDATIMTTEGLMGVRPGQRRSPQVSPRTGSE